MKNFFKVCSAALIAVITLNVGSVSGAYLSSVQDDQPTTSAHKSVNEGVAKASRVNTESLDHSIQSEQADNDDSNRGQKDCGSRHPVHHHCHEGHCGATGLVALSEMGKPVFVSSRFTSLDSHLFGVDLAGLLRPPRA